MTLIAPHIAAFLQQRLPVERQAARTPVTPTRTLSGSCSNTQAAT